MASSPPDPLKERIQAMMTEPATLELIKGVQEGDEALVRSALAKGVRPDGTIPSTGRSLSCLVCLAASWGHDFLLPHLHKAGLSIEGEGTYDRTPLMLAAGHGHTQTVKTLLSLGAKPWVTDRQGWTALHYAAVLGWQECVGALLPDPPLTAAHLEGLTPVHLASYHGQVQVLEQLAEAGWPLIARDSDGLTPLHWAAVGGQLSAVRWLVRRSSEPGVQDKAGVTALDVATHFGWHEVENWLAKNGGFGVTVSRRAQHVSVKAVVSTSGSYGVTGWRTPPTQSQGG